MASSGGRGLRDRAFSLVVAVSVVVGLAGAVVGVVALGPSRAEAESNLDRFASLTFGARGGHGALAATLERTAVARPEREEEDAGDVQGGPFPETPLTFTEYRTPNGWLLRPAGTQIDTPRAPTGVTVTPDAKTVLVVNSGIFDEQLTIVDAETFLNTRTFTSDLYMGVAADAQGNAWASTGSRNRVFQFKLLAPAPAAPIVRGTYVFPGLPGNGVPVTGYPGNMALGAGKLYVVGNLSVPSSVAGGCNASTICSVINVVDVSDPLAQSPAVTKISVGRDAYGIVINSTEGVAYVTNWADETNTNAARGNLDSGGNPTGTVSVVNLATQQETQVVPVGHHPTGLALSPDGSALFVTNSADDSLSKIAVGAGGSLGAVDTIDLRTTPDAPRGATPLAASFSAGGAYLLVALAGQNAVEVRTAAGAAIPRSVEVGATTVDVPHTYVPTGWYPSALATAANPSGGAIGRLYVTNLKGIGAGPGQNAQAAPVMGIRTQGTLSAIDLDPADFDAWTATVVENNQWVPLFDAAAEDAAANPCRPAPLPGGGTTFSQLLCDASRGDIDARQFHVVYVVKENKTFDQYFGDIRALGLPGADADPAFLLYGEPVTTNQHELARRYTVMDRFWADSEASTTGHSWTSAGYATEFNEITWNTEYDQGLRGNRWNGQYDGGVTGGPSSAEVSAQESELFDPEERLVDVLADPATNPTGATFRIYSDDVRSGSPAAAQRVPLGMWGLGPSAVHHSRDLDFPDTDRARIFLHGETVSHAWSIDKGPPPPTFGTTISLSASDKAKFTLDAWTDAYADCRGGGGSDVICQREMPNFIYMALPVDHTLGFNPLAPTPASMVADNDHATGMIIDELSKSPFWKNTLVLITEDDTQLAGDHVDAHRTFLLAAGGLARRHGPLGRASHQPGSFPSILKTVEVIFRLPSLTIYDRAAVPLHDVVIDTLAQQSSDSYDAIRPPTPFLTNPPAGRLAELSEKLDWRLDLGDPDMITALIYHGLRGWPLPEWFLEALGMD